VGHFFGTACTYITTTICVQSSHYNATNIYHPDCEGGIVFSNVCLCVCLFVNTMTPEPFEISTKLLGHHPIVKRADKFEYGYTGVSGWWSNVFDVLDTRISLFLYWPFAAFERHVLSHSFDQLFQFSLGLIFCFILSSSFWLISVIFY